MEFSRIQYSIGIPVVVITALGDRAKIGNPDVIVRGGGDATRHRAIGPFGGSNYGGIWVQRGWDVRVRLKDAVTMQSIKKQRGISFCRQPSPTSLVSDGSTHARSIT